MPPCPVSPPPSLALAMPWEAPGGYALVLLFVVVFAVAASYVYAKTAKPLTGRTRIGFTIVIAGSMIVVAGVAVLNLVLGSYVHHIVTWDVAQIRLFDEQSCSLAALYTCEQSLLAGAFTWAKFAVISSVCGMGVFGIGLFMPKARRRPAAEMSGT